MCRKSYLSWSSLFSRAGRGQRSHPYCSPGDACGDQKQTEVSPYDRVRGSESSKGLRSLTGLRAYAGVSLLKWLMEKTTVGPWKECGSHWRCSSPKTTFTFQKCCCNTSLLLSFFSPNLDHGFKCSALLLHWPKPLQQQQQHTAGAWTISHTSCGEESIPSLALRANKGRLSAVFFCHQ